METHATPPKRLQYLIDTFFKGRKSMFARYLGISPQRLNNFLDTGGGEVRTLSEDVISILKDKGINDIWVLRGIGEPFFYNEGILRYVDESEIKAMQKLEVIIQPANANVGSLATFYDLPKSYREARDIMNFDKYRGCKAVLVVGNSMEDMGILPGDLVMFKPDATPKNGDIVVCLLNGTLLIKEYHKLNNVVNLHSAKQGVPPIVVNEIDDHLELIGVCKSLLRDSL